MAANNRHVNHIFQPVATSFFSSSKIIFNAIPGFRLVGKLVFCILRLHKRQQQGNVLWDYREFLIGEIIVLESNAINHYRIFES